MIPLFNLRGSLTINFADDQEDWMVIRHNHCSQVGKCHSSDSIQAGVRPLNINSKYLV